MRRINTIQMQF